VRDEGSGPTLAGEDLHDRRLLTLEDTVEFFNLVLGCI
jgi:hypothetical protein